MNSDLLWHVSNLSGLLGQITVSTANSVAWADMTVDGSDYFCHFEWTDDYKFSGIIVASACSYDKLMSAIGFFVYHDIPYVLHD